ncbi:hypothetical protein K474DRAFT_1672290 [Panus rudis PR-1116 ss-1]|nr:hypothetical protein K474DRAFT_1672290 [Panus rudis PR-1116 ss-1]
MSSRVSGVVSSNSSPQVQAVVQWLTALAESDFATFDTLLTDDYVSTLLPRTLNTPDRTKEVYLGSLKTALRAFTDFKFEVHEVIEGENAVAIHVSSNAKTTTGHPYTNEYTMFFRLKKNADGKIQITGVKEFVDSLYSAGFFPAENERQKAAGTGVVLGGRTQ